MELLFAVTFALAAIGIGWPVVGVCDRTAVLSPGERTLIAFVTGALLWHFAVWTLGTFRYDAASMWALSLTGALIAIPGLRAMPWRQFRDSADHVLSIARKDPCFGFLLLLCTVLIINGAIAGLAPPADYDGLNYHLSLPKFDLERGFIAPGDTDPLGFMPSLMEMLYRLPLAVVGPEGAQLIHGTFGLAAAAGSSLLVRRWGFGGTAAACAAVFFLGIRLVVWESGTTYVDLALAAYTVAALVLYMAWRDASAARLMILFGGMIGGDIGTKYHGFPIAIAFGAIMLIDLVARPGRLRSMVIGPGVAALCILPFLTRNYLEAGNPLFPIAGSNAGLWQYEDFLGRGRTLWDLLRVPWDISIFGSRYFDGQALGAPYLLAFAPLAALAWRTMVGGLPALIVLIVYFVEWFWLLSQQIRFLAPVLPIVAALAGVGTATAWSAVSTDRMTRAAFVVVTSALLAIQGLFVGVYAAIRTPVALGLIDTPTYLASMPTLQGTHYEACRFISEHLGRDERFVWSAALRSYYCPQASMIRSLPDLGPSDLADYLTRFRVRFLAIETATERRDNAEGMTYRMPVSPNPVLAPALRQLRPVFSEPFAAVYDGNDVIAALRRW